MPSWQEGKLCLKFGDDQTQKPWAGGGGQMPQPSATPRRQVQVQDQLSQRGSGVGSKAEVTVRANLEPPKAYELGDFRKWYVLGSMQSYEHRTFSKQFKGDSSSRQPLVITEWFKTSLFQVNDFPNKCCLVRDLVGDIFASKHKLEPKII